MDAPVGFDKSSLSLQSPHILLVEDNRIALRLLESLIEAAGYHFTSTLDAEHACAKQSA